MNYHTRCRWFVGSFCIRATSLCPLCMSASVVNWHLETRDFFCIVNAGSLSIQQDKFVVYWSSSAGEAETPTGAHSIPHAYTAASALKKKNVTQPSNRLSGHWYFNMNRASQTRDELGSNGMFWPAGTFVCASACNRACICICRCTHASLCGAPSLP